MNATAESKFQAGSYTSVDGVRLHYRESGQGAPVLLLHGWPTSSLLWRNVAPELSHGCRVLALDLPGFGLSDKPLDRSYTFRFFARMIDGFLENLGIESTALVVHDLGGPVGLYWAVSNVNRVSRLAILNTLVYPEMSWAVKAFILMLKLPFARSWTVSPAGLRFAMQVGVVRAERRTAEMYEAVLSPFAATDAREALIKAGSELSPKGFFLIAQRLKALQMPVRIVYGKRDRILPDIQRTATRLQSDLPQASVTAIEDCGHFLQEDAPEELAGLLKTFLTGADSTSGN